MAEQCPGCGAPLADECTNVFTCYSILYPGKKFMQSPECMKVELAAAKATIAELRTLGNEVVRQMIRLQYRGAYLPDNDSTREALANLMAALEKTNTRNTEAVR